MAQPNPKTQPREFLTHLFETAVRRAMPLHSMAAHLPPPPKGRTIVIGAGKAAGSMAHALESLWPASAPLSGVVVTRYGHTPPRPPGLSQRVAILEAAHPVPDAAGLAASQKILSLVQGLNADDLVLCLISGGGSSLLTLPADGLTLKQKQDINKALLHSGANIIEMNCVRKHLSRIKGGRLAAACAPARVVTLTISDVPGDDPSVIASGPTVPDATTCREALAILTRYAIVVPATIRELLEAGTLETPKPADKAFTGHRVEMIATPQQSLEAAADAARAAGLNAYILSDEMEGESREVGKVHAALARAAVRTPDAARAAARTPHAARAAALAPEQSSQAFVRPCVILSGGETTVTVRPKAPGQPAGRGGRAGEFCLGLAIALQGQLNVWALAADTDGIDGSETNAGAWVEPGTLARAKALGLKAEALLDRNDAYSFFEPLGDLVQTGPTHTNVNDFRALLIL